LPSRLFEPPEKGYEIFNAEDPDNLYSKMAVNRVWNIHEHDELFEQRHNGVPASKPQKTFRTKWEGGVLRL
jgi:hypothetical protein